MLRQIFRGSWLSLLAVLLLCILLTGSYEPRYSTIPKRTATVPTVDGECFKWPSRLETVIGRYAAQAGVEPDLLLAVITQESGLDSLAFNPDDPSYGIGQVMPKWWRYSFVRQCGAEATAENLMRLDVGMCYTAHILSRLIDRHGLRAGLNAYNNSRGRYANEVLEEMTR